MSGFSWFLTDAFLRLEFFLEVAAERQGALHLGRAGWMVGYLDGYIFLGWLGRL